MRRVDDVRVDVERRLDAGVAPGRGSLWPAARTSSRKFARKQLRANLDASSLRFERQVFGGSHDRDTAERIQIEEIFVAGHDHVCAAVYRRLEELVILRIT